MKVHKIKAIKKTAPDVGAAPEIAYTLLLIL